MKCKKNKSNVHNDGIKLSFRLSKNCFLTPRITYKSFPFFTHGNNEYQKIKYDIMIDKNYHWLWFNFNIHLQSMKTEYIVDIPFVERLLMMLPPKINVAGKVFKLNFVKEDLIKISYTYEDEFLFNEVVSNNLRIALVDTIQTLKNTDNIRFMKNEYKKLYEESFNIEVPQERKFEPYYE